MKYKARKFGEKIRKMGKKKTFRVTCIIVLFAVIAGTSLGVFFFKRNTSNQASTTVQNAMVQKGEISKTVAGTGNLTVGETEDVMVPVGVTIEKIQVSSGDTVKQGDTLATVNHASVASTLIEVKENISTVEDEIDALSSDADKSGTKENLKKIVLKAELENLKAAKKSLNKLLKSNKVKATSDGMVASVNISEDAEVTKASTESGEADSQTGSSSGGTATVTNQSTGGTNKAGFITLAATSTGSSSASGVAPMSTPVDITRVSDLSVEVPVSGKVPQSSIASTSQYTGTITWDCSETHFQGDTIYHATILLTAKTGYTFADHVIPSIAKATLGYKVIGTGEGNSLRIVASFEKTASSTNSTSGNSSTGNGNTQGSSGTSAGSNSGSTTGGTNGTTGGSGSGNTAGTTSGTTGKNGSSGTTGGSSSASGSSQGSSATTSSSDATSENSTAIQMAGFSIATGETVNLNVNVDELDILSVEKGQSVTVVLDAVEDKTYTGTVTSVSNSADSSSESTKYSAVITIPKDGNMLVGMTASATINVEEQNNAILIPINALQEENGSSFVYTKKASDGTLSGKVTVETGLSNDSQVAITSGLEEGDIVYYTRKMSSSDSSDRKMQNDMKNGGMGGMGNGQFPSDRGNGSENKNVGN